MLINGKNYEVIKVYPSKVNPLKDLILCENEYGYKECFHRIDFTVPTHKRTWGVWTKEQEDEIRRMLKEGKTTTEISKQSERFGKTECSVWARANLLKREMNK